MLGVTPVSCLMLPGRESDGWRLYLIYTRKAARAFRRFERLWRDWGSDGRKLKTDPEVDPDASTCRKVKRKAPELSGMGKLAVADRSAPGNAGAIRNGKLVAIPYIYI